MSLSIEERVKDAHYSFPVKCDVCGTTLGFFGVLGAYYDEVDVDGLCLECHSLLQSKIELDRVDPIK